MSGTHQCIFIFFLLTQLEENLIFFFCHMLSTQEIFFIPGGHAGVLANYDFSPEARKALDRIVTAIRAGT